MLPVTVTVALQGFDAVTRLGKGSRRRVSGDGGFTDADEAMRVLFAQQAASALANARAHREEQSARADLEALVETCPVGVLVLDAGSGRAVSLNRETRRIAQKLRRPVHPHRRAPCRWRAGAAPLALGAGSGEGRARRDAPEGMAPPARARVRRTAHGACHYPAGDGVRNAENG